jgi:antitoxin component of RelBE/YafQ-DinJ toxin-antitoxin module
MARAYTSISIDKDLKEKAQRFADRNRFTFSTLIEMALEQFVKQYGELGLIPANLTAPEVSEVEQVAQ